MHEEPQLEFLPELVRLNVPAVDWREAVTLAASPLVEAGYATTSFADKLIAVIDKFGPYAVVAPGIVLAHAQPNGDERKRGIATATLRDGVAFGHRHYDPVYVVMALSSLSPAEHVGTIASIAAAIEHEPDLVENLRGAESVDEAVTVLRRAFV